MRSLAALPASLLALVTPIFAHKAADSSSDPSSGLDVDVTRHVSCSHPSENGERITMHYIGTLTNGKQFDQSYSRGAPFTFTLGSGMVIKGWDLGLLDMCPGEKRKLTIPPELAYGERGVGAIPGGSTLIFETEMIEIQGIEQSSLSTQTATPTPTGNATAPIGFMTKTAAPTSTATAFPPPDDSEPANGECRLLGPFALLVQGALGLVALGSLVLKRYRERPKRAWKIFLFDVSKQVLGSFLLHILNLAMSMFSSSALDAAAAAAQKQNEVIAEQGGERPNPCSFYMLNLGLDTTVGIPILYILLKILHALFLKTPLANPPESIQSGNYGQTSPTTSEGTNFSWYLKQCLLYFLGLVGMKFCVFFLLQLLPWLPWVGDWALRWTEGNEALQIAFVMFVFPLAMNVFQYWVIDSFIKAKGEKGQGYERVGQDSEGGSLGSGERDEEDEESGGSSTLVGDAGTQPPLKEANPTPIPDGGSGAKSPMVREEGEDGKTGR